MNHDSSSSLDALPAYDPRDAPARLIPEKEKNPSLFSSETTGSSANDKGSLLGSTYVHPPCFSRDLPRSIAYVSFDPMQVVALGRYLSDGFPLGFPPSGVNPHPFSSHDVNQADWNK
jgi:hypothetical protein